MRELKFPISPVGFLDKKHKKRSKNYLQKKKFLKNKKIFEKWKKSRVGKDTESIIHKKKVYSTIKLTGNPKENF